MKKYFLLERSDLPVLLSSYPMIFLVNYLILGSSYFENLKLFLVTTFIISVLYFSTSTLMIAWMKYMRRRLRELDQVIRRITYCLLFYIAAASLAVYLLFEAYDFLDIPGFVYKPSLLLGALLISWTTNIISVGITETMLYYHLFKESYKREFDSRQLHMQRQLDVLKQQVNPHFLFNSLNSLISLIDDNPKQAGLFAEELSSVYRYVLRANEQNLTDLCTELDFIKSYFHLLKTRHGEGLDLKISVNEQYSGYHLPPLTLQLLVENAVKHNIVLPEQPLIIIIETDEKACLTVRNTLQKKRSKVASNGVGLNNIMAKYQMLGFAEPEIQESGGLFEVKLQLIE